VVLTVVSRGWKTIAAANDNWTNDWAATFDLFPRPVGGANPSALIRILEKLVLAPA
jgi:hypothetical protein